MPDIKPEKVCFVIVKARELNGDEGGAGPLACSAGGAEANAAKSKTDGVANRAKLAAYIDAMDEDEQCELVALSWIGCGEFAAEEWRLAVARARARRKCATSEYLLENPLVASHLEYGLAEFGGSCEVFMPNLR
jgi:hypothetical protein